MIITRFARTAARQCALKYAVFSYRHGWNGQVDGRSPPGLPAATPGELNVLLLFLLFLFIPYDQG